jgi:hypothetical protein
VRRAQKAVPVHLSDDLPVALCKLHGGRLGGTIEAGKTGRLHLARISRQTNLRRTQHLPIPARNE